MSDESAFLAAIAANPADDLPRLVYADWLDEQGDGERAEFVRLVCHRTAADRRLTELRGEVPAAWADLMDPPPSLAPGAMFTPDFRERLRQGKYSGWAVNLTEGQLEAIIWMVGEYGYRAGCVLPLLDGHWGRQGEGRAANALESLFRVVAGDRPDREAYSERVRAFLAEVRGYAAEWPGAPPRSWPVEWQGRLVGWIVRPTPGEDGKWSGTWRPGEGAADFLAVLAEPPADGVKVTVGGIPTWADLPDDSGRMAFWLWANPNHPHAGE